MTSISTKYDVAVIGSGPAGSIASYNLSKAGLSVLLIEKDTLPRYKTCGGGVVYRARKLIPDLNNEVVERECYEIDWGINRDNIHFKVERPYPIISMVMRDKLDKHIVDKAISEGTTLLDKTRLEAISINGSVRMETSNGTFITKLVVGADGALGPTAGLAGIDDTRLLIPAFEAEVKVGQDQFKEYGRKVRFDVDAMPQGYGWVFPKRNHLSIGIASEKRGKINLRKAYEGYVKFLGLENNEKEEIHGFQIPIKSRKQFSGNRVLLTGDAAGLADPLVAEGISHALISGKIAAEAILEGNLDWLKVENLYNLKLKENVLSQTRTGQLLSKMFYRYPRMRKYVLSHKGQRLTEYFTDVFSGVRRYPEGFADVGRAFFKAVF